MRVFSDVVAAADELTLDEQETLIEILRRRIAECSCDCSAYKYRIREQLWRTVFAAGDA